MKAKLFLQRALTHTVVFALVACWLYAPGFVLLLPIKQAQAASALTAYLTSTNTTGTLSSTARQLVNSAPASETSATTKIAKVTGWCELFARGSSSTCAPGSGIGTPTGNGFVWDVTTLEGQQILNGNWTGAMKLKISASSGVTVTAYMRAFLYNGSTYTPIATSTAASKALTSTAAALTFSAGSGALTNFNTGNKLYVDFWVNITANTSNSSTNTISLFENGGAAEQLVTPGYQLIPTTTIADGTNPGNITIAPGAGATDVDGFDLSTNTGTDTVTAMTVTLSTTSGIAQVDITDSSNAAKCTAITNPSSTTANFTGCSLALSTSVGHYKIRVTPKSHANMPGVPGGAYAVTATVTSLTDTNPDSGTDTSSATVTIDNASPSDVTSATTTPSSAQIIVSWTNPGDSDFSQVVVLRSTTTISDVPVEGASYIAGNSIGSSTVVYAGSGTSVTDSGLANGTTYYYKIFSQDTSGNYSTPGVQVSDTPASGPSTITIAGTIYESDEVTPLLMAEPMMLSVASTTSYSATSSAADGSFSFTGVAQPATGTVLTIWLNTNGGDHASLVTKYGSEATGYPDYTGIKLFLNHVRINSKDGSVVTLSDLKNCNNTAGGACSDTDIGFTASSTMSITFPTPILRVAPNATFAPGANISAKRLEVAGTYTGSNETITLSGSGTSGNCESDQSLPLCVTGTFNTASTTVAFTGTSTSTIPALKYYNLSLTPAAAAAYSIGGSPWYDTGWGYRKSITIDHNKVASSTGESYANFPLLVSLTDSDLKDTGNGGHVGSSAGNDILFTAGDGITKLNHEIESYASSTGQLTAWVNVGSSGLSTSSDTTLYLYYGNAAAADQSDKTGVWDSQYRAVYHLSDNAANKVISDSTSNANTATSVANTANKSTAGQFASALNFNGASDTASTLYAPSLSAASQLTLEAWVNASSTGSNPMAVSKNTYAELGLSGTTLKPQFADNATSTVAGSALSTSTWHSLVGVADGQSLLLYVDGVLAGSASDTLASESNFFYIGSRAGASSFFPGMLDEVRISNAVRSADWITTEYNNESSTSTFYNIGFEETPALTVGNNLTIGDGSHTVIVTPASKSISVAGTLSVASGTLNLNSYNPAVTASGNVAISNGATLNASASSPLTVEGNFTNNGTFNHNNGSVIFDPITTSTISGTSTAFYDFTSQAAGATLKFQAQSSSTPVFLFSHSLTLAGTSGSHLSIQSDTPGTQWLANFGSAMQTVNYVRFTDSGCGVNAATVDLPNGNISVSNNGRCWSFYVEESHGGAVSDAATGSGGNGSLRTGGNNSGGSDNAGGTPAVDNGHGEGSAATGGGAGGGGGNSSSP